jgi:hypothetical protein
MNFSRHVLLGMMALALPLGLASAQAPGAPAPDSGGLIGGAGLYLIQPFYENNPAYNLLTEGKKPEFRTHERVDVRQHLDVAPLVWLGYLGEDGLGGRARYWYFRQATEQSVSLPPFTGQFRVKTDNNQEVVEQLSGVLQTLTSAAPLGLQAFGDTLSKKSGPEATTLIVTTRLEVQVLDLEGILDFVADDWTLRLAGGVRLARLAQRYDVTDLQSEGPQETRTLLSSYRFQGAGPVLAVEARLPVGDTGVAAYGNARGAFVFGQAEQQASFGGQVLRNEDPNPQVASDRKQRGLAIAELELGLEYRLPLGGSMLFVQVGVVAQDWLGAGNASHSTNFSFQNAPPAAGGAVSESDLAFLGLAVRVGVDY